MFMFIIFALSLTYWALSVLTLRLELHLTCGCLLFLRTAISKFYLHIPRVGNNLETKVEVQN